MIFSLFTLGKCGDGEDGKDGIKQIEIYNKYSWNDLDMMNHKSYGETRFLFLVLINLSHLLGIFIMASICLCSSRIYLLATVHFPCGLFLDHRIP